MTHKVFKFGSRDLIRFIEIYRNNDCLWDIQNSNYKSRDARNAALKAFAEQFDVEGFGPKEITAKIKNLRTQYHGEKRKIKDSMETGDNIYQSKLPWYSLMDSFLGDTCEYKKTIPNMVSFYSMLYLCIFNRYAIQPQVTPVKVILTAKS